MSFSLTGVICCGNICYDIPVWPVSEFRWGTTTWVEDIQSNIGGNGGNTSVALARLGTPVRLIGMAGRDRDGDVVLEQLAAEGVNASGVGRTHLPTACTVCLVHPSGDRMFFQRVGASQSVHAGMLPFDSPQGHSHFHLANLYSLPVIRTEAHEAMARARRAGMTTSLDTGWDARGLWLQELEPALPFVDLLFVNESEARMLTGHEMPGLIAKTLRDMGAASIALKLGERGCVVFSGDEVCEVAGHQVNVVDTTGAGDSFAGGFLSALYRGCQFSQAAKFANAVGSLSVERLGTVAGVRSYRDTEQWLAERNTLIEHQ